MRFIFANSGVAAAIQQHAPGASFFLTLDKLPTVEIDAATELLVGQNACTLLLENDANRAANAKVLESFDMIMQMADDQRRLDALRAMLETIRNAPHRNYFLFFDTSREDEAPVEFRVRLTCVRSSDADRLPKTKTVEAVLPLSAFTRPCDGARATHSAVPSTDTVVSVSGTARKSIINGFAMLCVQTICVEGWTSTSAAVG